MHRKNQSPLRIVGATKNTLDGVKVLWHQEQAFRTEVFLGVLSVPCIFLLHAPSIIKLLLVLLSLLLLVVETLNSALESVVDRISLEIHPQSKIAKDMGSAAVGMVYVMNIVAWVYAFLPH